MAKTNRTTRLEARLTEQSLALIRRAAELQGRSLSDFVVVAAEQSARQAIQDAHVITLSVTDQERFAEILINPPIIAPALLRAREAHSELIRSSSDTHVQD